MTLMTLFQNDLQVAAPVDLYETMIAGSAGDGGERDGLGNEERAVADVVADAENDGVDGLDRVSTKGPLRHGAAVQWWVRYGKWRGDCLIGLVPLQQLQPHGRD
ncbi:hypothetical protein GOP47_0022376 [Adiantum capillus-veneris]|uniref:Uncharacterized protein n=1 Tax=Adiantum capillus-veneris TaxID=13818 RepID=A0A9D4Z603_ADICA|nr:hypothetical protein GOP47_0022376 [Adiantum capillus-veneris]